MDLIPRAFSFVENQSWASNYVRNAMRKISAGDQLSTTDRINTGSALFDTVAGRQPTQAELFARLSQFTLSHPNWGLPVVSRLATPDLEVARIVDFDLRDNTQNGGSPMQPSLIIPGTLRRYMPPGLIKLGGTQANGDVIVTPSNDAEAAAMRTFMER